MKIALASDHAGWRLKEGLKAFLHLRGFDIHDYSLADESPVDYTETGATAATAVANGEFPRAILICGTGLGMTILANKFPGIRACLCHDSYSARMSRAHNDCNVLVLGGRVIGLELAKDITALWIDTPFAGGRHQRRLNRLTELEGAARLQRSADQDLREALEDIAKWQRNSIVRRPE